MTLTNPKTVIDIKKVQSATFWYVNQHGTRRSTLPKSPTASCSAFDPNELALAHPQYPKETMMQRAKRLGTLDVWTPLVCFHFSANHSVEYEGEKAKKM